jgi:hypothetical protein
LDSSQTIGIAQQNAKTTPAVMRSVGHRLASFENSIISQASEARYAKRILLCSNVVVMSLSVRKILGVGLAKLSPTTTANVRRYQAFISENVTMVTGPKNL